MKLKFHGQPPAPRKSALRNSTDFAVRAEAGGGVGYDMADTGRLYADWTASNVTSDTLLRSQLCTMRNRSRDFARNEDYMRAFLGSVRNNVVGPCGISLQMDVRDPARPSKNPRTGLTEWMAEPDDLANDAIENAWDEFSKPAHFTTNGRFSRVLFEQVAVESLARDGGFLFEIVKGRQFKYGVAIRPICIDYLDETKNEVRDGKVVSLGVERDAGGRHTGYWIRTYNPGDMYTLPQGSRRMHSERYDADRVRHVFVPTEFDLSQGVPWIHAGATRLKMLKGYEEAALEAARAAACKHEYLTQMPNSHGEYEGTAVDASGNQLEDMAPGTKEILPIGMTPVSIDPKYPHNEHGPFITTTLMGIAAGLHVSYHQLTGDLSNANYSSLRAGLLPERDMWKVLQAFFITHVTQPIFEAWLEMALMSGAIMLPNGAKLPPSKFERFNKPMFLGRRWAWVDPAKDQSANETALRNHLTSHSKLATEQGDDLEEIFRRTERDLRLAEKYGLSLDASFAAPAGPGAPPKPQPEDDETVPPKKKQEPVEA